MTRYYFHVHDGKEIRDPEGVEFADVEEARTQAIRAAGEILRDQSQQTSLGDTWRMRVEDAAGDVVCMLTVTIE